MVELGTRLGQEQKTMKKEKRKKDWKKTTKSPKQIQIQLTVRHKMV